MSERTNEGLADWLCDFIENPLDGNIQRRAPGKFREIERRLREMPEGERREGYVRKISPDVHERLGFYIADEVPGNAQHATLILQERKEGESE